MLSSGRCCKGLCADVEGTGRFNARVVDIERDLVAGGVAAVKEECYVEVSSYGGDTTGYQIPFNIHYTGVKTKGTFDPASKKFTEA